MPNRILREGILTSPRIAKLGWAEEVFYRRLHSVVDDFGRYFADPGLLRAACYPRQLSKVSDSDIGKWLRTCEDAALVRVYPSESGEQYLQLLDFGQQVRAKKSKFPDPLGVCAASATQVPSTPSASAHLDVSVSEDEVVSGNPPLPPKGADERFEKFWAAYPKKINKDTARKAWAKRNPDDALLAEMLAALEWQKKREQWTKDGGQFVPYPATWLNAGGWQDMRTDDIRSITVPGRVGPDPELEKIKAHKGAPIPPEIAARMAALKGKVH